MERQSGYYWVRYPGEAWSVARWDQRDGGWWWVPGNECEQKDKFWAEIGPMVERPAGLVD